MCGLAAALTRAPLSPERRQRALASLSHRGPDDDGHVTLEGGALWLGHTRLAIISPEDGRQPLSSEDGAVHAIVGGEIYGHRALRRELETRGHRFATSSDSEVLIHLYEERGLGFVDALRGELAFVLWDARERRLVAGRDRFGVKPLAWARDDRGTFLASEAKALFALGVSAAWDEDAFLAACTHQYLAPERTLFAGIRQVPPGHLLVVEDGRSPRLVEYWDLDLPRRVDEEGEAPVGADAELAVRAALEDSVRARLDADVPVAFASSGGLDSALVAALAARTRTEPIHTFGVAFAQGPYDERAAAREVARHLGAVHHVVDVSQDDLLDALPDAVAHGEGLAINGQLPAKLLLARAIRRAGFGVVLTGEGSDELFYGYPHLALDLADTLPADAAERLRARTAASHEASRGVMLPGAETELDPLLAPVLARLSAVPAFLRAKVGFGRRTLALLDGEARERVEQSAPLEALLAELRVDVKLVGRHPVAQSAYLWTKLCLAGYILRTLGDGTEMAASIEGRTPFLDPHVAAVAAALPLSAKLGGGIEKRVLREVARGLLPETTRHRPKHPFLAPPLSIHSSPRARALMHDTLDGSAIEDVPFVDRRAVRAALSRMDSASAEERREAEPTLFTLLTACLLARRLGLSEAR